LGFDGVADGFFDVAEFACVIFVDFAGKDFFEIVRKSMRCCFSLKTDPPFSFKIDPPVD